MNKLFCTAIALTALTSYAAPFSFPNDKSGIDIIPRMNEGYNIPDSTNEDSQAIHALLTLEKDSSRYSTPLMTSNPYDTHIKQTVDDIKLRFDFKPVPSSTITTIGFAPIGIYSKDGWTGVKQFFKSPALGICEYSIVQLKYVAMDSMIVLHDVNGKITNRHQGGNAREGYLYTLTWFEEMKNGSVTQYEFNCATRTNDNTILNQLVAIAKTL